MIRVHTEDIHIDRYEDATGWKVGDNGSLQIVKNTEVIAMYRNGFWHYVAREGGVGEISTAQLPEDARLKTMGTHPQQVMLIQKDNQIGIRFMNTIENARTVAGDFGKDAKEVAEILLAATHKINALLK